METPVFQLSFSELHTVSSFVSKLFTCSVTGVIK